MRGRCRVYYKRLASPILAKRLKSFNELIKRLRLVTTADAECHQSTRAIRQVLLALSKYLLDSDPDSLPTRQIDGLRESERLQEHFRVSLHPQVSVSAPCSKEKN